LVVWANAAGAASITAVAAKSMIFRMAFPFWNQVRVRQIWAIGALAQTTTLRLSPFLGTSRSPNASIIPEKAFASQAAPSFFQALIRHEAMRPFRERREPDSLYGGCMPGSLPGPGSKGAIGGVDFDPRAQPRDWASCQEGAMEFPRRHFLYLAASAAALPGLSQTAEAQAYPTR